MVWAYGQDDSWRYAWGCVSGIPIRGDIQDRPRTCWRDYTSWLAWKRLGVHQEELVEVTGRGVSGFPCSCYCPCNPDPDKQQKMNEQTLSKAQIYSISIVV